MTLKAEKPLISYLQTTIRLNCRKMDEINKQIEWRSIK